MKNVILVLLVATICLLAFVPNKPQRVDNQPNTSPIEGSWELYSTEKDGKTTYNNKPSQIKVYHDGYFCMIAYWDSGKFRFAAAGTYEFDGIHYKETATYHTSTQFIGASIWVDNSVIGDTLITSGFKKVVMADGKDVTKDWGGDSFIEKKVRVKK